MQNLTQTIIVISSTASVHTTQWYNRFAIISINMLEDLLNNDNVTLTRNKYIAVNERQSSIVVLNSWVAGRCGYTALVLPSDQVEVSVHAPGCSPTKKKNRIKYFQYSPMKIYLFLTMYISLPS